MSQIEAIDDVLEQAAQTVPAAAIVEAPTWWLSLYGAKTPKIPFPGTQAKQEEYVFQQNCFRLR